MSFLNATSVDSPSHHIAAQLYASLNVDYTQLNWFERNWMAWYLWIGNPIIATGIASFILHEVRFLQLLARARLTSSPADRLFRSLHTLDHH
jgi:methylsterol monooxygenase